MTMMAHTHTRRHFLRVLSIALLFFGAGMVLFAGVASAQLDLIKEGIVPTCDWEGDANYALGLGAFVFLARDILHLIWGILGSLALIMFVWGGFLWLTARGEEQQIKQGWDTLINAVIGLVIVLGSWVIINTIILSLTSSNPGSWDVGKLFGDTAWTELAKGTKCVTIAETGLGTVPLPPALPPGIPPATLAPGAGCSGDVINGNSCPRGDCQCQSGRCINEICVLGGVAYNQQPGGCCYVEKSGGKRAKRDKYPDCEDFLTKKIAAGELDPLKPIAFCPFPTVGGPFTELEVCWEQALVTTNYNLSHLCTRPFPIIKSSAAAPSPGDGSLTAPGTPTKFPEPTP